MLNPEEGIVRATPGEMLGDYPVIQDTTTVNADITIEEVRFALTSASKRKALGENGVLLEVLLNEECTVYLTKLFNVCFGISAIPDIMVSWNHKSHNQRCQWRSL